MRDLWPNFTASKTKAITNNATKPYLFNFFNVVPLYPGCGDSNKSVLGRIHNQLVNGLNNNDWLPKYIIILPDHDMIEEARFGGFGCKTVFEHSINWLTKAVQDEIDLRRKDISKKKPGALPPADEPVTIWIPMLICPFIHHTTKGYVFAQSHTFNEVLKGIVSKFDNMVYCNPDIPENRDFFDLTGAITNKGKSYLWRELKPHRQGTGDHQRGAAGRKKSLKS